VNIQILGDSIEDYRKIFLSSSCQLRLKARAVSRPGIDKH
jgi:hypothetical protein